jgi:hypothetical protein
LIKPAGPWALNFTTQSSVKNSNAVVWQGLKVGSAYSFSPAFEAYSAKSLRFRALAYEPSSVSMRFMVACSSA